MGTAAAPTGVFIRAMAILRSSRNREPTATVGVLVGTDEGCAVSNLSSAFEGGTVGDPEGITDGTLEGTLEGTIEGVLDGHDEGMVNGADDGDCDG